MLPLKIFILTGMGEHACNDSIQEAEAEASLATKEYIGCYQISQGYTGDLSQNM